MGQLKRLRHGGGNNYQRVCHGQGKSESGDDEGEGELHVVS